jgi:hypothetical protein
MALWEKRVRIVMKMPKVQVSSFWEGRDGGSTLLLKWATERPPKTSAAEYSQLELANAASLSLGGLCFSHSIKFDKINQVNCYSVWSS